MSNRTLGVIAMVCAPAMLVEALVPRGQENALIVGIASMVFMAGWICTNTAMRRMRAAGDSIWGRAVLLIQLAGLVLALLFGFLEATGLLEGSIAFSITDAAWPLSMLWMFLPVGITVIVANRLPGWRRFVPLLCGLWLPIGMVAMIAFGDEAGVVGFGLTAVLWTLLGYVVFSSGEDRVAPGVGHRADPATS